MVVGGALLVSTMFIQTGPGSILLGLTGQFLGFLLLALGTLPASPSTPGAGRWVALSGSLVWLLSWWWRLFGAWFIPIPLWAWASIAAAVYAVAALVYFSRGGVAGGVFSAVLAVGSVLSAIPLILNPVFAPVYTDLGIAVGAISAATVSLLTHASHRGSRGSVR